MVGHIFGWVTTFIESVGLWGVAILMLLESACIPIPSELILPFAGFLASNGTYSVWAAIIAGSIGGTIGCLMAYTLGFILQERTYQIARRLHLDKELHKAEKWLHKHGEIVGFTARLLPGIRTFISLPMGMSKTRLIPFIVMSFLGTFLWCTLLGWTGYYLGAKWDSLKSLMHYLDFVIIIGVVYVLARFVYHRYFKKGS